MYKFIRETHAVCEMFDGMIDLIFLPCLKGKYVIYFLVYLSKTMLILIWLILKRNAMYLGFQVVEAYKIKTQCIILAYFTCPELAQ